jgi:polysaccharide deacetylase 2 family uncharacterized protein YibQ
VGAGIALFALGIFFGGRLIERAKAIASERPAAVAPAAAKAPARTPRPGPARAGQPPAVQPATAPAAETTPVSAQPGATAELVEPAMPRVRVAIVIDDLGRDRGDVERLLALGQPLTYAVLPFEPRTEEIVALLRERRAELLLHLPMEPEGEADPGPGALSSDMSRRQVARATRAALEKVPGAVGVNNHMGSALTADSAAMHAVLAVLAERRLYFLDSRTSAESVGFELARASGIPAARRDLFLDEVDERDAIEAALDELVALAREQGAAVGIAHPRDATLAVLAERLPRLRDQGVEIVPLSFLVERSEELPE